MPLTKAKREQSKKTVERILNAATSLFVAHGYHGTSISAIAKATGLTKGALYAHFQGKGDLLLALVRKFEEEYLDQTIRVVDQTPGSAWDQLQRYVSFSSYFAEQNRELCLLLTILSSEFSGAGHEEFESEFRRLYSKYARFLRKVVEKGKHQGVFDSSLDTHHLAYVIIAFHDGVLLQWQRSKEFLDGPDFVRTYRRMFFHGINPLTEKNQT
ncbi:MAG: TetR/AcrR family transcriptional regulator [Proteobacteria bacterium]|nr:TetR/AcrR family transcriptional regulator [Pseudomonadota bacterium]